MLPPHEPVVQFDAIGVRAFVTTRAAGSFRIHDDGSNQDSHSRWQQLVSSLAALGADRLVSSKQVHGVRILTHRDPWEGWQHLSAVDGQADGHIVLSPGGAAAVTIADCVPVFIAHPGGVAGIVHAGWRGVAGGILGDAIKLFESLGFSASELRVHLGPSICGRCYEVGAEVFEQLTGWQTSRARNVDLRGLLAEEAKGAGVKSWSASPHCTRCDNDLFYSHRQGDEGRQVGVIIYSG